MIVSLAMVVTMANGFCTLRMSFRMIWLIYYLVQNSLHFQLLFFHIHARVEKAQAGKFEELIESGAKLQIQVRCFQTSSILWLFYWGRSMQRFGVLGRWQGGVKGMVWSFSGQGIGMYRADTRETTKHKVGFVQNMWAELWLISWGLLTGYPWGCI